MQPLITVVVACYNHEKYIREAIDSVMAQTWRNFELIITDDGSTDRSREIIRQAVEEYQDDRIRCDLHEENTCFACVEKAYFSGRGKYIAGIGGDDSMKPEKLEKQATFLENCGGEYQACFTWTETIGDQYNEKRAEAYDELFRRANVSSAELLKDMFETNQLNAPSMMMLQEVYNELGGYDFTLRQLQDYDLWIRFLMKYRLWILPEPLTIYRAVSGSVSDVRSDSVTARTAVEDDIVIYEAMQEMPDALIEEIWPDSDPTHHTPLDLMCRRVKAQLDRTQTVSDMQAALMLYYRYRKEPGFEELLETRYGLSRKTLHQYAAGSSVYAAVLHFRRKYEKAEALNKKHRFLEKNLNRTDEEMVEELLQMIELSDEQIAGKAVTLDHICALYELCGKLPEGAQDFEETIRALREKGVQLFT